MIAVGTGYCMLLNTLFTHFRIISCLAHCLSFLAAAGALEEVDWLKLKLETLEAALLSGSLESGLLAALDGGSSMSRAEVLEAAHAAVQSAVLQSPGDAPQQDLPESGSGQEMASGLLSLEPLASQLASATQAANAAAEAAARGQVVGGQATSEMLAGQVGNGRASIQVEAAMPAEQQPTAVSKPPLIERLLISEALEAPPACAAEPCEAAAVVMAAAPAAGVTATVSLVGSDVGSKACASEAGQQAEHGRYLVAGESQF